MKKILSVILVLSMVLALGVTAFAAVPTEIKAGESVGVTVTVSGDTSKGVTITDPNGILVFTEPVVGSDFVAFNITAPAGSEGKIAQVVIKAKDNNKTTLYTAVVTIEAPAEPEAPKAEDIIDIEDLDGYIDDENNAFIEMPAGVHGISAAAYNWLKGQNFETINFVSEGYIWTLTRGDYTKMNVTASIYFGVSVSDKLYTKEGKEDLVAENAVLKALGNTKADVFYVTLNDNVNIGNVASKPALVVEVSTTWVN